MVHLVSDALRACLFADEIKVRFVCQVAVGQSSRSRTKVSGAAPASAFTRHPLLRVLTDQFLVAPNLACVARPDSIAAARDGHRDVRHARAWIAEKDREYAEVSLVLFVDRDGWISGCKTTARHAFWSPSTARVL
jgi:hypothetical protein